MKDFLKLDVLTYVNTYLMLFYKIKKKPLYSLFHKLF